MGIRMTNKNKFGYLLKENNLMDKIKVIHINIYLIILIKIGIN